MKTLFITNKEFRNFNYQNTEYGFGTNSNKLFFIDEMGVWNIKLNEEKLHCILLALERYYII